MLEIPEAPTAPDMPIGQKGVQIAEENAVQEPNDLEAKIDRLIGIVESLDQKIKEVHTVMVFLGRKAQEMEHTPLGKLLGGFGKKG
jgi:hypothetical protein